MFLYYFFNKGDAKNADKESAENLKEIWHMHYCFELAIRNSINVENSVYKYNDNTTQLYGTIEDIAYKLYNENLISEAIYQNFENGVTDLNTQLNTEIYKN